MEKWKTIKDWPGYSVSARGNMRGPRAEKLKLVETEDGYLKVTLCANGKRQDKRVNRLVAEAFIPNPENYSLVMHLDNDRKNNNVDNLAWGTHSENNQYMYDCDRHPINLTDNAREKAYSIRRAPVKAINIDTGDIISYVSQHEAARQLGVSQQHIWGVLNGHRRSTGGYRFEYAEKDEVNDC